jgi:histidine triad (HIT) family protein
MAFATAPCLVISKRHVPWWHELPRRRDRERLPDGEAGCQPPRRNVLAGIRLHVRARPAHPHTQVFLAPTTKGDVLDGVFNALERFQESSERLAALETHDALAAAAERIRSHS